MSCETSLLQRASVATIGPQALDGIVRFLPIRALMVEMILEKMLRYSSYGQFADRLSAIIESAFVGSAVR